VKLSSKLIQRDVLNAPSLNCNVAALIEDIYCIETLTNKLCVIQDPTTRTLVGVGESRRGVYFYKDIVPIDVQVNKVVSYGLWHCRLGHPSSKALSNCFNHIQRNSSDKNDVCDACLRAKQTHVPFHVSENKDMKSFDLIHYGIWEGYHVRLGHISFVFIVDVVSRATWARLMKKKR